MRLFYVLLLLSVVCSEISGSGSQTNCSDAGTCCQTGHCNGNIYIPIIVILCEALLLSVAVNVYFICMTRHRDSCQNFYNNYIAVWCRRGTAAEPEQSDDLVPDDTQYSALSVFKDNRECEEQSEVTPTDCVYSAVKC